MQVTPLEAFIAHQVLACLGVKGLEASIVNKELPKLHKALQKGNVTRCVPVICDFDVHVPQAYSTCRAHYIQFIAVMEVIAATRRRKEQLLKEIEDIKVAIKELESNQLCEFNTESEKEVQDTEALMHALMVTENINRIKYTNTELISLEENTFEYQADANTGPVYYHLKFNITFSPDGTQPSVSDLKITLNNEFIQNELKPWQNKCIRDSSLQTFQRGIVSYGELFIKRKEIFLYLKENAPEYFLLEICVEDGKYIITAIDKKTDTQYFCCSWAITWNCATFSMINFFSLQANNKVPFFNKNKDLFTELTELASNVTSDRVEEIWKTLANNVIEEISSSLDSSEDENTFV